MTILKGQGLLRHEFALEETQLRSTFEWHNENRQVLKQTKNYVFHSPRGENENKQKPCTLNEKESDT